MVGIVETLAIKAGEKIAEEGVNRILKSNSGIFDRIRDSYKILDQEIRIFCPENIQRYSILFEAAGGILPHNIEFPYGVPNTVTLRPVRTFADLNHLIKYTDDGFIIDLASMNKDDTYVLSIEYNIVTRHFLQALVERNRARETPKGRQREYWMHAELKHPKYLRTRVGKLSLEDVDFNVDVGISGDIKTIIPPSLKEEIESSYELVREHDVHKKYSLGYRHARAMRKRGKDVDILNAIRDLQALFFPSEFCNYVEVTKDFHYDACIRGTSNSTEMPLLSWPNVMKVISRANLGLDNYTAEGVLVYKKNDFLDEVKKILKID